MMMPSIFGRDMFDDFFGYPFEAVRPHEVVKASMMQTDIKELDHGYEITMNIPGVKKDDVKAELKDGYLTIQASANTSNDEKDSNGRYIRRERHFGTCSRSFYVGEEVKQEEIKAKFEDGTLKLFVPKQEEKQAVEDSKYIRIEG